MASHRGRHRRPGKIAPVITVASSTLTAGAITAGMTVSASAAVLPPVHTAVITKSVTASRNHPVPGIIVKHGDTLSGIAADHCGTSADWTGIYDRNRHVIGGNPDLIIPGQDLVLRCKADPVVTAVRAVTRDVVRVRDTSRMTSVSTSGMSGFQACVIRAESGGNPQIWNPSGHWGLYQFSEGTWVAHGGNAGDFGRADATEQTRIFWNTVHADGGSDWSPYDGCTF